MAKKGQKTLKPPKTPSWGRTKYRVIRARKSCQARGCMGKSTPQTPLFGGAHFLGPAGPKCQKNVIFCDFFAFFCIFS